MIRMYEFTFANNLNMQFCSDDDNKRHRGVIFSVTNRFRLHLFVVWWVHLLEWCFISSLAFDLSWATAKPVFGDEKFSFHFGIRWCQLGVEELYAIQVVRRWINSNWAPVVWLTWKSWGPKCWILYCDLLVLIYCKSIKRDHESRGGRKWKAIWGGST